MNAIDRYDPMRALDEERLAQALERGARHADTADRFRLEGAVTRAETGRLEDRNRERLARQSVGASVLAGAIIIGILGCLILDFSGMSAMSAYFAGLAFPDWPQLHTMWRVLFPLGYGAFEIFLGVMLDAARERERETGKRGLTAIFFLLAIVFATVPVAFMISTHQADVAVNLNIEGGVDLSSMFFWKLVGVVALGFASHAALIAAGPWVREAWGQMKLASQMMKKKNHLVYCDEMVRKHELLGQEEYVRATQCWQRLKVDGTNPGVAFGPFDIVFASLIERRFGSKPSPETSLTPPPPAPPPVGGAPAGRAH